MRLVRWRTPLCARLCLRSCALLCALLSLGGTAAWAQQVQQSPEASPAGEVSGAVTTDQETKSWSATVALVSDYAWRGVSFSRLRPAVQSGIDWTGAITPELNLEAGAWLYSSRYQERPEIHGETGYYAGINGPLPGAWRWALRSIRSVYPQASDWTYAEHSVHLSRPGEAGIGSVGMEIAWSYSPRAFGSDSNGRYVEAELKIQLLRQLALRVHAGRSEFSRPELAYRDFNDVKLALGGAWRGVDIEAGWIAASNASQFGGMGRARAVLSLAHAF